MGETDIPPDTSPDVSPCFFAYPDIPLMYDLAFLPESEVVDGMQLLHGCVTDVEETDKLYIRCWRPAAAADDDDDDGASVPRITLHPLPPLFPVSTWNVHVAHLHPDSAASTAHHLCSTT